MGDLYVDEPNKKFLIVRNGKKDALFDGNINNVLKAIPAKGFATVTILLVPPEHYGDYDYIVNITTDKNARLYGAIGLLDAEGDDEYIYSMASIMTSLNKVRANFTGKFKNTNPPRSTSSVRHESFKENIIKKQEQINSRSGEDWTIGTMSSHDIAKEAFYKLDVFLWTKHIKG